MLGQFGQDDGHYISEDDDTFCSFSDAEVAKPKWEMIIGLEVHAQVLSKTKLFSRAGTMFGLNPNTQVDFLDVGMPGTLPVLNAYCVRQAIKAGLALNATVNRYSRFDRKNYHYPDLPSGYQITQFYYPIVQNGFLDLDEYEKRINIERIHLEQDAGKILHDKVKNMTAVDFNRSGMALMEVVTQPDFRTADEVRVFIKKLRSIFRYTDVCDGSMEQGSLRVDVNLSMRPYGTSGFGTRCEMKNINSLRFIAQAISYERQRQIDLLEDGMIVRQETRLFDAKAGITRTMRDKENAHDYRYFPDPNLPPLCISQGLIDEVHAEIPELPDEKKERFIGDFHLTSYEASVLTDEKVCANYYESVVGQGVEPKLAASWIMGDLFAYLKRDNISMEAVQVDVPRFVDMLKLVQEKKISGPVAKMLFERIYCSGEKASDIVEQENLYQVLDADLIDHFIDEAFNEYPEKVKELKSKPKLLGWFVGQIMKKGQGRLNPAMVNERLAHKVEIVARKDEED